MSVAEAYTVYYDLFSKLKERQAFVLQTVEEMLSELKNDIINDELFMANISALYILYVSAISYLEQW